MRTSSHLIHPISDKLLRKGHPWVTLDQYSKKFSSTSLWIKAINQNQKAVAYLINDPHHKNIKARVWTYDLNWKEDSFLDDLKQRIHLSFTKRKDIHDRENIYWIFGEADALPGLMLLQLKDHWIFQIYSQFWFNFKDELIHLVQKEINQEVTYWWHDRSIEQKTPQCLNQKEKSFKFELKEFQVNYWIRLGDQYDYGIYTDMADIRHRIPQDLIQEKNVLNLFSYTGAFSLFTISQGANKVTSIDLSSKYIAQLEDNLDLNNNFKNKHQSIIGDVIDELEKWDIKQKVDFIICDPPSVSSNGNKKVSALKNYERLFPLFDKVLTTNGYVLTFLNTHTISWEKFLHQIKKMTHFKIVSTLDLGGDCPLLEHFSEGRYLKGIIWKKND